METETLLPSETPTASDAPVSEVEPLAVYDGDISDAIMAKLSAYYREHSHYGDSYTITRPAETVYELVYGESEDGVTFEEATVITYQVSSNWQSSFATMTRTTYPSYTVDTTGHNGYIYSSSEQFIPSRYINNLEQTNYTINSVGILILVAVIFAGWLYNVITGR